MFAPGYPHVAPPTFSFSSNSGSAAADVSLNTRERSESLMSSVKPTFSLDYSSSPEASRSNRSKEASYSNKYGHRHHSYDAEKAPYPMSYDKEILGLDLLDNEFQQKAISSVSFINWKDKPPSSVLDLGCGTGAWIIDAAKQWPHCHFVGFDLVKIQPPESYLDRSIAGRVRWVHGNFLTTKLPFDDDGFDLVRIKGIGRGVPENKWSVIFSEVHRVLCPGGLMESIEEDIKFPILPRWFTNPLRARSTRAATHLPDGSQRSTPPTTAHRDDLKHEHALLECLFYSIFDSRFINTRPTAILPAAATQVFRHVRTAPVLNMNMPPLAPLPPSNYPALPEPAEAVPLTRSQSLIDTSPSVQTVSSSEYSIADFDFTSSIRDGADSSSRERSSPVSSVASRSINDKQSTGRSQYQWYTYAEETTSLTTLTIFNTDLTPLLPQSMMEKFAPETLATHLYCAAEGVLGCQEAMWEQLKDMLRNKVKELQALGWEDEELEEMQYRKKFETLVQRYRDDMHCRVAFWYSLVRLGWEFPPSGPLSRAEIQEEARLRQEMLEARKSATDEELKISCRSIRVLVGTKGTSCE